MNEDYRDILQALVAEHARFLIVGAHALALHGYPPYGRLGFDL